MPPAFSYAFSHYLNVFRTTRCTRLVIVPSHRSAALYAKPVLISVLSTHTRLLHYELIHALQVTRFSWSSGFPHATQRWFSFRFLISFSVFFLIVI